MIVHTLKEQAAQLNKFMVKQFIRGVKYKYINLLIPDENIGLSTTKVLEAIDDNKLTYFLETMLKRSQATISQFKRICCIIIKFLECCEAEFNYLRNLKFNLNKLIVAAFIMSTVTTGSNEGEMIIEREKCYQLYSRITGLSVKELINCCAIVRPVVVRRTRRQKLLLQRKNNQIGNHVFNADEASSPTLITSTTSLHQIYGSANTQTDDNNNNNNNIVESFFENSVVFPVSTITRNHLNTINPSLVLNSTMDSHSNITNYNSNNIHNIHTNSHHNHHKSNHNNTSIILNGENMANTTSSITNQENSESDNGSQDRIQSSGDDNSNNNIRQNKYNQGGSEYVLPSEIEQFNIMGQKLVRDYFKVV